MRAYKHSNKPSPDYHEQAFNWEKDLVTYFVWFCLWCALCHDSEHARQTNKRLRLSCIMQYSLHNRCYFLAFFRQGKAIGWRTWSARHERRECNRKLQLPIVDIPCSSLLFVHRLSQYMKLLQNAQDYRILTCIERAKYNQTSVMQPFVLRSGVMEQ